MSGKMGMVLVLTVLLVAGACGDIFPENFMQDLTTCNSTADEFRGFTELLTTFVMFRHGDRTPDQEELDLYPSEEPLSDDVFFPYGKKALTNKGKQRSYLIGKYLRERYDGFLSKLYLPDEITIRTTEYDRTKMTALTALSALYPPEPAQKWNPFLDWQPIPYKTPALKDDDLLYWYTCHRFLKLRNQIYTLPEVKEKIDQYSELFKYLSEKTKRNISTTEDVFFIDNLFQTLANVGVQPPAWAQKVMPEIKKVTILEYAIETYSSELIKLAAGVLMKSILDITHKAIDNYENSLPIEPKMHIYSAHENNVAAMMAASRVFYAHQPHYGATYTMELRRNPETGEFGFMTIYAPDPNGEPKVLAVDGCENEMFCEISKFDNLVKDFLWTREEMVAKCQDVSDLI